MFEDIPVEVGVVYEGERIRKSDLHAELGGPNVEKKFELVRVKNNNEIKDQEIKIVGPDILEIEEGSSIPFGILIEVAGKQLEEELEGVIERRIHEYTNYIEGFMHLNQRYDIWCRVSKKSVKKGLESFEIIGKVLLRLFKNELPFIDSMQITFLTDKNKVAEIWEDAVKIYEARDARARKLTDNDVTEFYGCDLCQSFAPTHVCTITPQRYANCGAISWFDGRAASKIDPKGPIYKIEKGECIDPVKGEYSGINENAKKKSLGEINKVWLYTAFGYPHTSCGCFEAIAFYVPEADGLGIVHRDFKERTVNGLPFSTMADSAAGGRQVDGFHGLSIEYMRSPKFLQVDGGWDRVVWIPKSVKERLKDFIPSEIINKLPTEDDVKNLDELKEFLKSNQHPVVGRWKEAPSEIEIPPGEELSIEAPMPGLGIPTTGGGFKIILKGAKIQAKKVIIKAPKKGR
ncbi:CO dehydrogenase/CO-methylating acetyl-CoA synthase complex subunit beta [Candidatus Bathyarchaeota archaeon]|nr:CO dehydrogenase/CO-methylating acetyl-CoA synthase complex subunit beta [Candidatus Bathyarchaeota archaeon]